MVYSLAPKFKSDTRKSQTLSAVPMIFIDLWKFLSSLQWPWSNGRGRTSLLVVDITPSNVHHCQIRSQPSHSSHHHQTSAAARQTSSVVCSRHATSRAGCGVAAATVYRRHHTDTTSMVLTSLWPSRLVGDPNTIDDAALGRTSRGIKLKSSL